MTARPNFVQYAAQLFRAWITDGVPASGVNNPLKSDARTWGAKVEASLTDLYRKAPTTLGAVGGTANAITATGSPTVDALAAGETYILTPGSTNTLISPTLAIDSLTATVLANEDGDPLHPGRLVASRAHVLYYDGSVLRVMSIAPFQKGYLFGLLPANDSGTPNTKIDIGAGQCRSDDDTVDFTYGSTFIKDLSATWVVGSGNGGLDTGALGNSLSYDIYAVGKVDGTAPDFIVTLSSNAGPAYPSGYAVKRLVGQFMTDASAHIRAGTWYPDGSFTYAVPISDAAVSNAGTAAVLRALSAPPNAIAVFNAWLNNVTTAAIQLLMTDPAQTDTTPTTTIFDIRATATSQVNGGEFRRRLNSSSQVRTRQQASGASDAFDIVTRGWITDRKMNG